MIRDITIGQYYKADSFLHRLDPRVKIVGTLLFIFSLFLFSSPAGMAAAGILLAAGIKASKVPLRRMLRGLQPVFMLLAVTILFQLFLTPGDKVLQLWKFTITKEGIRKAFFLAVRLVMLILGSSSMTFTTTPNQLTDGLEKIMGPLKKIRVPVHEIAMMMSIALRFIPILIEELDKIIKAQTARGADFESGGLIRRARNLVPVLVPLFVAAFRRADDLALAMEARCYQGGEGRTKMKPLEYKKRDLAAYGILAGYLALQILLKILI